MFPGSAREKNIKVASVREVARDRVVIGFPSRLNMRLPYGTPSREECGLVGRSLLPPPSETRRSYFPLRRLGFPAVIMS